MYRFSLKNARKPGEPRTEPPPVPTGRIRHHVIDTTGRKFNRPESFVTNRHGGKKSRNRKNKRKGTRKQKRNKRV